MNKRLVIIAFLLVATSAARADSYDQLEKKLNAPGLPMGAEKLPARAPAAPPVDVTWIYGNGPDALVNTQHVVIDEGGTYSTVVHICARVDSDEQKLLVHPVRACEREQYADHFDLVARHVFRIQTVRTAQRVSEDHLDGMLSGFSGPALISDPSAVGFDSNEEYLEHELHFRYTGNTPVLEFMNTHKYACSYKSTAPDVVRETCKGVEKSLAKEGRGDDSSLAETIDQNHYWWPTLQVFMSDPYEADKILDIRHAGSRWASQDVSDKLSPAQKEQARALFAQGFDQYKTSNFPAAEALVAEGLKIDPANYKGWQVLGDINKSAFKKAMADGELNYKYVSQASLDYQRVIDLAPGSPDAIIANSALKEWDLDYKDMNSNNIGHPYLGSAVSFN